MTRLGLCVVAASAGLVLAQPPSDDATNPANPPATTPPAAAPDAPAAPAADARAKRDRLLRASRLPKEAHECREKGVPDEDMKAALRNAKRKGLKADETSDVTTEQRRAIDEHGPVDNFGAFVQSKLDEGLRGKELAAAIKAEHAKRGKGKGYRAPGKGKGKGKGDRDRTDDDATVPIPDDGSKDKPERPGADKGKGKGKEKGGG